MSLPLASARPRRSLARAPRLLLASAALLAVGACGGDPAGPSVRVVDIAFSVTEETINVGQTKPAVPSISYSGTKQDSKAKLVWRSSAPTVASVDTLGRVTGITPGEADISVSADGRSASVRFLVLPADIPALVNAPTLPAGQGDGSYSIRLVYVGEQDQRAVTVASAAINKWRSVITGDLTDLPVQMEADACYEGQPASTEQVDDMLIFVKIEKIDGPGKVLARAGPCFIRSSTGIPVVGVIEFDLDDLDRPAETVTAVFTHEIGHVLGIGPRWLSRGLLFGRGGDNPLFVGAEAYAAYRALGAGVNDRVPVENTGGSGTRDSHWREGMFRNELMTGFVNSGANPLSAITVASLRDLGYRVDMSRADGFTLTSSAVAGGDGEAGGDGHAGLRIGEELLPPRYVIDDVGAGKGRTRRYVGPER